MDKSVIDRLEQEMRLAAADLAKNLSVNNPAELRQIIKDRFIDGLNRASGKGCIDFLEYFSSNGLLDEILDEAVAQWKEDRPAMYLEIKSRMKEIKFDPAAFVEKVFNRMIFSHHKRVYFHLPKKIGAADKEICQKMIGLLRNKFIDNYFIAEFI